MRQPSMLSVSWHKAYGADAALLEEILSGLIATPKRLHPKFLYDAHGSELFDRICELPEYYLTRTETAILREHAAGFAASLGPQVVLIELGSGSSLKTRILLDALTMVTAYVPVDISRSHLLTAAHSLARSYRHLEILPVCADFTQPFPVPKFSRETAVVFFPGSTIGNFYRDEAVGLLRLMAQLAGEDGVVIVGADLRKDPHILERAYNDSTGITAAFNLNLLTRLNNEFGADFDPSAFEHRASWIESESRIEMHLVSRRAQSVHLGDRVIEFEAGESIWTESCHKYDCRQFAAMAAEAGLQIKEVWTDRGSMFSVQVLARFDLT